VCWDHSYGDGGEMAEETVSVLKMSEQVLRSSTDISP